MTLQEKSLATIELPKILEMLAAEAATPPAKELCRQLRPETSLTQCEKLQEETDDASRLIGLQGSPRLLRRKGHLQCPGTRRKGRLSQPR